MIRTIITTRLSLGRNFDELKQVIVALQTADALSIATPADWRPGERVIVPPAGSCGTARTVEGKEDGVTLRGLVLLHQRGHRGEVYAAIGK